MLGGIAWVRCATPFAPEAEDAAVQQVRNVLLVNHRGIEDFGVDTAERWSEGIDSAISNARLSGGIIAGITCVIFGIAFAGCLFMSGPKFH